MGCSSNIIIKKKKKTKLIMLGNSLLIWGIKKKNKKPKRLDLYFTS